MAIAGAVVVPGSPGIEEELISRMKEFAEVEVREVGPKGIAIVLEAEEPGRLRDISNEIEAWEDVMEVSLAYLNWEEEA